MAISNMQQAQQLRANGGIMTIPRQNYGLGKLVKKAVRGIKKVAKSPIGKAALLYAGGTYLGGSEALGGAGGSFMSRLASPKNLFNLKNILGGQKQIGVDKFDNPIYRKLGLSRVGGGQGIGRFFNPFNKENPLLYTDGKFSGKKALLAGGLGAMALPFMMGGGEEEEEITDTFEVTPGTITDIVSQAKARAPNLRFLPQNAYTQAGFFNAAGGGLAAIPRTGYSNGGSGKRKKDEDLTRDEIKKIKMAVIEAYDMGPMGAKGSFFENLGDGITQIAMPDLPEYLKDYMQGTGIFSEDFIVGGKEDLLKKADGGRIGYAMGGPTEDVMVENVDTQEVVSNPDPMAELNMLSIELFGKRLDQLNETERGQLQELIQSRMQQQDQNRVMAESGGMIDYMSSANPMADSYIMEDTDIVNMYRPSGDRQMAAEGGIMDLGGMEKDYREEGGFVPIGGQEKADDVPARLSKNEFVFTADAVRNAGGGDIDKGAEVMENLMNNLEQGGEVSEDSQGMNPAQKMFDTAQMLEGRIA